MPGKLLRRGNVWGAQVGVHCSSKKASSVSAVAEPIDASVVDHRPRPAGGQAPGIVGVGQTGGDETSLGPGISISCTVLAPRSALRPCTATLRIKPGQLQSARAADTRGGTRNQCGRACVRYRICLLETLCRTHLHAACIDLFRGDGFGPLVRMWSCETGEVVDSGIRELHV